MRYPQPSGRQPWRQPRRFPRVPRWSSRSSSPSAGWRSSLTPVVWTPAQQTEQLPPASAYPPSNAGQTGSAGQQAPHYHYHQDTHHHHWYFPPAANNSPTLAFPPFVTLGSGGCLVVFLVLLGAFLTIMVLLMGFALIGQLLALP